jgi:hypothetical protein
MTNDDDEIITDICDYVQQKQIKEYLGEYFQRIILNKPEDPIKYLLQSIREKPYVPSNLQK